MDDTICAVASAVGNGAISIIRVSGKDTIKIVNSIFSGNINKKESHIIKYGYILDGKEIIDEVLLMIMLAPKTYTTEDTIEIDVHGGINTTNRVLELLLKKGCRLAEAGEFTKRAFLNGRINLLQSESVNDLIKASSDSKRKMALNGIGNNLTLKIKNIRELLVSLMANIEVNIDYPEYTDNLVITENLLREKLFSIDKELTNLVSGARYGSIVSNGINIAIVGKPNVGKSSILNHLLDEEKAIVTDIAGTTRDLVEGKITLNGIEINLIDTAGIRDTSDVVEKIGVERSLKVIDDADLILLVLDGTKELSVEDQKLLDKTKNLNRLIFINKNDDTLKLNVSNAIYGNTKDIDGLNTLKEEIIKIFDINKINKDLTYLSNARQIDLVNKADKELKIAKKSLESCVPIDMIENNLKSCYEYLGQIIGDVYEDAIIDRLFKDFCVGK